MQVYELSRDAYRALVLGGMDWLARGDVNGPHTAYELEGLGTGDWLLVEMVAGFGRVGRPVVIRRYDDEVEALLKAARWESDALKLARYYGCTNVRGFEVWHVIDGERFYTLGDPMLWRAVDVAEDGVPVALDRVRTVYGTYEPVYAYTGYVAVETCQISDSDWLIIGETRFESLSELGDFFRDGEGVRFLEATDCGPTCEKLAYYHVHAREDSEFPEDPAWSLHDRYVSGQRLRLNMGRRAR